MRTAATAVCLLGCICSGWGGNGVRTLPRSLPPAARRAGVDAAKAVASAAETAEAVGEDEVGRSSLAQARLEDSAPVQSGLRDWTHRVRIAGYGLRRHNADAIVRDATADATSG